MEQRDQTAATRHVVDRFNEVFNRHEIDSMLALMTDDCVFESTAPPDGVRYEGHAAVEKVFGDFFASSPGASFEAEDIFTAGDRCAVQWLYRWSNPDGTGGHVRGVDLFQVRDGKVAKKLSYVKG